MTRATACNVQPLHAATCVPALDFGCCRPDRIVLLPDLREVFPPAIDPRGGRDSQPGRHRLRPGGWQHRRAGSLEQDRPQGRWFMQPTTATQEQPHSRKNAGPPIFPTPSPFHTLRTIFWIFGKSPLRYHRQKQFSASPSRSATEREELRQLESGEQDGSGRRTDCQRLGDSGDRGPRLDAGCRPGIRRRALAASTGGGRMVLCRDGRPSGVMLRTLSSPDWEAGGAKSTIWACSRRQRAGWLWKRLNAAGGIQITASHNPAPWNGLKLFGPEGRILPAEAGQAIGTALSGTFLSTRWHGIAWAVSWPPGPQAAQLASRPRTSSWSTSGTPLSRTLHLARCQWRRRWSARTKPARSFRLPGHLPCLRRRRSLSSRAGAHRRQSGHGRPPGQSRRTRARAWCPRPDADRLALIDENRADTSVKSSRWPWRCCTA